MSGLAWGGAVLAGPAPCEGGRPMTAGWISPRWVPAMIYCVVLAAGLYDGAVNVGGSGTGTRLAGFAAVMVVLFAVEAVERRWPSPPEPRWAVLALLAARLGLFAAAAVLDPSGESRALFILVPFAAYFAFGRGVSLAVGGLCLALRSEERRVGKECRSRVWPGRGEEGR